jgi:hypothetical protein
MSNVADDRAHLSVLVDQLGLEPGQAVEFGCYDGLQNSHTAHLLRRGWKLRFIEQQHHQANAIRQNQPTAEVFEATITPENVNRFTHDAQVVVIDIDGNDYWMWHAMQATPAIVVVEYNCTKESGIQLYDPNYRWRGQKDFGTSFVDFNELAERKGYKLAFKSDYDIYFVRANLCPPYSL